MRIDPAATGVPSATPWSWRYVFTPWRWLADYLHKRADYRHRFRLENEIPLYRQLWSELFELRRCAHDLMDDGVQRYSVPLDVARQKFVDAFNAYQATVMRNGPFIHDDVHRPAMEAKSAANHLDVCCGRRVRYSADRPTMTEGDRDELCGRQIENDADVDATLDRLDNACTLVESAIRTRTFMTS